MEHVEAHRNEKKKQQMSLFEKLITEGNEKADELEKVGTMLDGGFVAQARASTVQQEREEVYAALQYAASFHCLVEDWEARVAQVKREVDCRGQEKRGNEAPNGVVCHNKQVSVHETWKRQ